MSRRRSRAVRKLQRRIETYYGLEGAPDVADFIAEDVRGEREQLLVRETEESLELLLVLPDETPNEGLNDGFLQYLEGVSHFVFIAERARIGLPATQLELELQAEVDKFVLFAFERGQPNPKRRRELHRSLYDQVLYLHPPDTEAGERYRLANELAARLTRRVLDAGEHHARDLLRRFYRAGQSDKIRLAQAA